MSDEEDSTRVEDGFCPVKRYRKKLGDAPPKTTHVGEGEPGMGGVYVCIYCRAVFYPMPVEEGEDL